MKTITRWDHLSEFGIVPLTGESCGLGYRMLCDVTAKGKIILEKCFGIPDLHLPANWNQGSAAEPHVGSIMLAPELLVPVAVFALLENGCKEVWKVDNQGVHGIQFSDPPDTAESLKKWLGVESLRRLAYRGTAGEDKLLVTVRPHLQAKHMTAIRDLKELYGPEYKPVRIWPSEGSDGWIWRDYPIDVSTCEPAKATERKPRPKRSRVSKSQ